MNLKELFSSMDLELNDRQVEQFSLYTKLLKEYNDKVNLTAITEEEYKNFESNKATPSIDIIKTLCVLYKVTLDEFYGNTPRLSLHSEENNIVFDDVDENILKMSDLSWEEAQLILYYRAHKDDDDDEIIKKILEKKVW